MNQNKYIKIWEDHLKDFDRLLIRASDNKNYSQYKDFEKRLKDVKQQMSSLIKEVA